MANPQLPPGVPPLPEGITRGSPQYFDWLAHQPAAARKYWVEDYEINQTGPGGGVLSGKAGRGGANKRIKAAQDQLLAAQEKALSHGETLPDVDKRTGAGIQFSSPAAEAKYRADSATWTAGIAADQAAGITAQDVTVNPTFVPTDQAAAHPEDVVAHIGDPGQEAVTQEQAIAQARQNATGANAIGQSISDETNAINAGGLDAIDRARLQQAQMKRGMESRAAQQAIQQQAEQQGRFGSNASLVARQSAQQGSENQQAQDDAQTMALGLERKNTLMANRATQGLGLQTINDALDHFNTQGQRDVEHANAIAKNTAAHSDIGAQRQVAENNTEITNKALGAGMGYRAGVAGQNTDIANTAEQINKGPSGGASAMLGLTEGANAPLIGTQESGAGMTHALGVDQAAQDAQRKALPYTVVGNALDLGIQGAKAAAGK